jgi:mono/diheme cytochrome c family protein
MAASESEFSISSSSTKSPSPGAVSPPSPSSPLARSGAPLNGVAPYLVTSMHSFAANERTNNGDMPKFMQMLTDSERDAIARYLSDL